MIRRLGAALFGLFVLIAVLPGFALADVIVPQPVKPQVIKPAPVPAPAPAPSGAPTPPDGPPDIGYGTNPNHYAPNPGSEALNPGTVTRVPNEEEGWAVRAHGGPGHPDYNTPPPDPTLTEAPFPNLPWPYRSTCDNACLEQWRKFLTPLDPPLLEQGASKVHLFHPSDPNCQRSCLSDFVNRMRDAAARPNKIKLHDERTGPDTIRDPLGAAERILSSLGFKVPPTKIIGKVTVLEGEVYADPSAAGAGTPGSPDAGQAGASSSGAGKSGASPRSGADDESGGGSSGHGPAADDIDQLDNPFDFGFGDGGGNQGSEGGPSFTPDFVLPGSDPGDLGSGGGGGGLFDLEDPVFSAQ